MAVLAEPVTVGAGLADVSLGLAQVARRGQTDIVSAFGTATQGLITPEERGFPDPLPLPSFQVRGPVFQGAGGVGAHPKSKSRDVKRLKDELKRIQRGDVDIRDEVLRTDAEPRWLMIERLLSSRVVSCVTDHVFVNRTARSHCTLRVSECGTVLAVVHAGRHSPVSLQWVELRNDIPPEFITPDLIPVAADGVVPYYVPSLLRKGPLWKTTVAALNRGDDEVFQQILDGSRVHRGARTLIALWRNGRQLLGEPDAEPVPPKGWEFYGVSVDSPEPAEVVPTEPIAERLGNGVLGLAAGHDKEVPPLKGASLRSGALLVNGMESPGRLSRGDADVVRQTKERWEGSFRKRKKKSEAEGEDEWSPEVLGKAKRHSQKDLYAEDWLAWFICDEGDNGTFSEEQLASELRKVAEEVQEAEEPPKN